MYLVSTGIAAEDALRSVCMTNALGSYGTRSQKNAVRRLAQDLSHRFVIDVRIE